MTEFKLSVSVIKNYLTLIVILLFVTDNIISHLANIELHMYSKNKCMYGFNLT